MANKIILLGMLVMVLVFGMTVVGCGGGNITGTWYFPDLPPEISTMKFENGTLQFLYEGIVIDTGTYTIKGNKVTMYIEALKGMAVVGYSVKGNTLTLTIDDESFTGSRVK